MIIGVQKGGTTSLFSYLAQHPDLVLSKAKEPHFFDEKYSKGIYWYKSFFPIRFFSKKKVTGEASPYYFLHPLVPYRINKDLPKIKFIVLLRDPVQRAYSHFNMSKEEKKETIETFEEAIELEEERIKDELTKISSNPTYNSYSFQHHTYLTRGKYYQQLKIWLEYFDLTQFHFVKSENFFLNPKEELGKIYNFLNIKEIYPSDLQAKNIGNYQKSLQKDTAKQLKSYFYEDAKQLKSLLGNDFTWEDEK